MSNLQHPSSKFRADINALRALAVTLVVFYHFNIKGFSVGFLGVDIFFVISGFLMTQIIVKKLETNRFSYSEFIFSRIKRIWPALTILIMVLVAIGFYLLPPVDFFALSNGAKDALLFVSNLEFAKGKGYFTTSVEERWFLHSWSLSVEWQFYCLYPLILLGLWRLVGLFNSNGNRKIFLSISLLIVGLLSYISCLLLTPDSQPQAFFSLMTRAWEMIAGANVLLLSQTKVGQWFRYHASIFKLISVGMFLSCVGMGHGGNWTLIWPGSYAAIPVVATAIYILAESSNRFWAAFENHSIVQALGNWSYSIYLWHWPIVIAINYLWLSVIPLELRVLGVFLSVILGFISFRLVESHFRVKQERQLPQLVKALVIYFLVMLTLIFFTNEQSRFNKIATQLEQKTKSNKLPKEFENQKMGVDDKLKTLSLNSGKNKEILIIGDSHAEHLYPWFKKFGVNYTTTFAITAGCPPFPKMNRFDDSGWHCNVSFQQVMGLVSSKRYDLILISGNWYPIDQEKPTICPVIWNTCKNEDRITSKKIAISDFTDFINDIGSRNIPIIILRPTPFAQLYISKILPRYNLWGLEFPKSFKDNNYHHKNGDLFLNQVIESAIYPNLIHILDLREEFCINELCRYFDDDGEPVFWDDNHFSPTWLIKHGSALFKVNELVDK